MQHFPAAGGVEWYHHVVYEGKSETSYGHTEWAWVEVRSRVKGYGKALEDAERPGVFCIGVIGKRVMFWHYHPDYTNKVAHITVHFRKVKVLDQYGLPRSYEIDTNKTTINTILDFMVRTSPHQARYM